MSRRATAAFLGVLCALAAAAGFVDTPLTATAASGRVPHATAPWRSTPRAGRLHHAPGFQRAPGARAAAALSANMNASQRREVSALAGSNTAAPRVAGAPPSDPPSLLLSFPGNQQQDAMNVYTDQDVFPPDDDVAAGPSSLVETTNDRIMAFDKSGSMTFTADINSWARVPAGYTSTDPRVVYDQQSGRFFVTVMAFQPSGCGTRAYAFASPASGNLNDTWPGMFFTPAVAGKFGDQPGLGVSSNVIAIAWNLYNCSNGAVTTPYGDQVSIVQKSDLLAGNIVAGTLSEFLSTGDFGVQPVHMLASTTTQDFIENGSDISSANALVFTSAGTPEQGNVMVSDPILEPITQTSPPPLVDQPGTTVKLDADDDRFLNAVWGSQTIWTAATIACTPSGDTTQRACLDYVQVATDASGVPGGTQPAPADVQAGVSGTNLFYPAVTLDSLGDLFTVFNRSSTSNGPAIVAAAIDSAAGGTTLTHFTTLHISAGYYDTGPGTYENNGADRWGDYNGAAQDPSNPADVWVVGEDVEDTTCPNGTAHSCWDTRIGRYTLAGPVITGVNPAAGPVAGGQTVTILGSGFLPGSTVTLDGTTIASPTITPNSIQFATPAHSAGLVYVQVSDALGTTLSPSTAAGYLYVDSGTYHPVTPFRIYDSRTGTCVNCNGAGPLGSGTTRLIPIADLGITNGGTVPVSATAVVLNVTAVNESSRGFMSLWPAGTAQPSASDLNFNPNVTVANLVSVVLGQLNTSDANREIDIAINTGTTNAVIDVEGYFEAPPGSAGTFHPIPPLRICDSRGVGPGVTNNVCNHGSPAAQPLGTGVAEKINVTGALPGHAFNSTLDVPTDGTAEGVVLNLTAVLPKYNTYLSVFPTDAGGNCSNATPPFSNVNLRAGGVQPNRVMVRLGPAQTGGPSTDICVWNFAGPTNFIIDLNGWYGSGAESSAGDVFQPIGPTRVCDSRTWAGTPCSSNGPLGPGATATVAVTLGTEAAVLMNVTAVLPSANTYLALFPADTSRSAASPSDLNPRKGITMPNCVVVKLSTTPAGRVKIYNNAGTVDYIFDVGGWFESS